MSKDKKENIGIKAEQKEMQESWDAIKQEMEDKRKDSSYIDELFDNIIKQSETINKS
jgi:hypothetical protein